MPTLILIPILLLVDSLHFVFARLLFPLSPPSVSVLFVLSVATLEVGIFGVLTKRLDWSEIKRKLWLFIILGLLISSSTTINYGAVEFIDPGIAAVLSQTGTVWAVLFGLVWLKEILRPGQILGTVLAVGGIFLVNFQAGDYVQIGSLLVLLSSALYALHAALAKKFSEDLDLTNFFFARLAFSTAAIFLFSTFTGSLAIPQTKAWPYIVLAGTFDVAVSRALYYIALRRLKLTVHTILLTLSPVIAILLSALLFDSKLTIQQAIGGVIVLGGVMMVAIWRDKTETNSLPQETNESTQTQ
jgi:drug/metabolite transporter (DMT)-like permease